MTFLAAVAAVLWADSQFQALSPGGVAATVLPEGATLPATTYMAIGGTSDPTFDTSGMQRLRVEFNCRAADAAAATAARQRLVQLLNGYAGRLGDGTRLQCAELIDTMDFFDNEARQFRAMAEFYLTYNFNF